MTHYGGNPLALKLVAATNQDLFSGSIAQILNYVQQGSAVFDDIRDLLQHQFDRLSDIGQEMLFWLAINREPVSLSELRENLATKASKRRLPDAMQSLLRRSLIEKEDERFFLQPVVLEYATDRLVQCIFAEIASQSPERLRTHALIRAQAKDYVREMQKRSIVEPIAEQLQIQFGNSQVLEQQLKTMLEQQQQQTPQPNYLVGNILNLLVHLHSNLRGCDFSELTVWQADLRQVNLAGVNFRNADLATSVFAETLSSVMSVSFNPDGSLLATGDLDGKICLWRAIDGQQVLALKGHAGWVTSLSFSPNGHSIASSSEDASVRLWSVQDGTCFKLLQGHSSCVWEVAFNPNGQTLASGSADLSARLWDVRDGICLKTFHGRTNGVCSVSFSPDGSTLASGSYDTLVRLWHMQQETCFKDLPGHTSWIWAVAFHPNGQMVASASNDRTVRLWDVRDGTCLRTLHGHTGWVLSVTFSPDGQTLATGSLDSSVRLWDVRDGTCLTTLHDRTNGVRSVTFSPNGRILASGNDDRTIRLWDVQDGTCQKVLQGHTSRVCSVQFSPIDVSLPSGISPILVSGGVVA